MTKFFPWQIFRKVYLYFFVMQTIICVSLAGLLWGSAAWSPAAWSELSLSANSVVVFAVLTFLGAMMTGLWLVLSFLLPLRQAIIKTRSIANKKFRKSLDSLELNDLKIDTMGEFSVLESQLDEIYRKMKGKNEKIAREREELRALMSSITDSILAVDSSMNLLFCNDRYREQFLLESDPDMKKGDSQFEVLRRFPTVVKAFEKSLQFGRTIRLDFEIERENEETLSVSLSVSPLFQKADPDLPYGAIGVFHDLSETRKMQKIKSEFVANASHELRTPMTSLKGYVITLKEDLKENRMEDAGRFIKIIEKNVNRLIDLTNDLLTISKMENSEGKIDAEMTTLSEIHEAVIRDTASLLKEKSQRISFENEGVEAVYVDGSKLQQVLMNLVTNACKYMDAGGAVIVKWTHGDKAAFLSVSDEGPGIPLEHQGRIFERFYRIDKGRARSDGGTGLGLSIVKHIVNSHGGSIELKSEMGKGTEFICSFPYPQKQEKVSESPILFH